MEIVLRAIAVFVLLWLVLRVTGKREISQLSPFELILMVTLGDLVSQTVVQEDYSLTSGALAVATFGLLSVGISYLSWRFPAARPLLDGRPTVILRDGRLLLDVMRYERLPEDEVYEAAREHGLRDLADVDLAVLENDGTFSFFQRQSSAGPSEGGEEQEEAKRGPERGG